MSNPVGSFAKLADAAGIAVQSGEQHLVAGIVLTSALVGSLTVTGITQSNGSAQSWVIAGGSSGWQACPGSGTDGGAGVAFSYGNAADYGKAYLLHSQR